MRKIFILYILIISISSIGFGQRPTEIILPKKLSQTPLKIDCMGEEQDAGTWHLGNFNPTAQSNDVSKNRIFLCAEDRIPLIHDRNESLEGDPDPTSDPGIGYGFYECEPTIEGNTLTDIQGDPCHEVGPPAPPAPSPFYVIVDGNVEGDLLLNNDGYLNNTFNGGAPGTWWFAPITFDSLAVNNGTMMAAYEFEGGNKGPCVNVRTDEAVEVTYLNPFEISNINTTPQGDTACAGSFTIEGGLPEYDSDATYDIEIVSSSNMNNRGTLSGSDYGHGDEVNFTVPLGGEYLVTIQDGKSCVKTIPINLNCNSVDVIAPMIEAEPGESICVPITVENFDSLITFSFTFQFDPSILSYDSFTNFDIPKDESISGIGDGQSDEGEISFAWATNFFPETQPLTLPDGSTIIEFCFTVQDNARIGDMSPLNFGNSVTSIEAYTLDSNGSNKEVGVNLNNGKVTIISGTDLVFEWRSCGTETSESNGEFTITAYNGAPPYDVSWTGPSNGNGVINADGGSFSAENIQSGFYTVTITDSNGVTYMENVLVNDAPPIVPEFNLDVRNPSCYGEDDGEMELAGLNASAPFSVEWSTGEFTVTEIEDLRAGNYSVTVTDQYGCEIDSTRTIKYVPVEINASTTNVSCQGQSDGSARITASGGQPNAMDQYTFSFEDGSSETTDEAMRSLIGYGWHSVTVTDVNGCETVDSFFVDADKKLIFDPLDISDANCFGAEDGTISVTPGTQGAPPSIPYAVEIESTDGSYNDNLTGVMGTVNFSVPADQYIITLSDASGCSFDTTITINQPPQIQIDPNIKNESCDVGNDGFIALNASGGAGDLNFIWDGGSLPLPPNDSVWQLSAGSYMVTITDENGCTREEVFTINAPTPPTITSIDSVQISCNGTCDGELTVQATQGGSPISSYEWVNESNDTITGQTLEDVCDGTYTVYVNDNNGCVDSTSVTIGEPQPIDTSSVLIDPPTCFDGQDGSITLSMNGGTPPYTYQWSVSGAADDPTLSNIGAGSYSVTVSDQNNCGPFTSTITITEPPSIQLQTSNIQSTSCYNTCDGGIIVDASGGATNGPFTYEWENGTTGPSNSNLCSGESYVIVSDPSCIDTFYVTIPSPEVISFNYLDSIPPSCSGESDGRIEIEGTGGTGSYIYDWSDGTIDSFRNNLTAGGYDITITDGNGCVLDTTIQLGEPDPLNITFDSLSSITCAGDEDGYVSLDVSGGNGGYSYDWTDNISSTASANNLPNGFYSITVTDNKGCTDTISTTLSSPPPINFTVDNISDPDCFGESTTLTLSSVSGGNGGPFIGNIDGENFSVPGSIDVLAGDYTLTISDVNGCTIDTNIIINQPPEIGIDLPPTVEVPLGDSIILQPTIVNLTSDIESMMWSPSEFVDCDTCKNVTVSVVDDASLTFKVTDQNGCMGQETVNISVDKTRRVYIPSAFTPNGDGVNELFKIYVNSSVESIQSFQIFNRWGSLVWERTDVPIENNASIVGWNGTYNGRTLNPDVFMFKVKVQFKDGLSRIYKGDITILDTYGNN